MQNVWTLCLIIATKVLHYLMQVLNSDGSDLTDCRGHLYDNINNMAGWYLELQACIKEINIHVEYIPCTALFINLVGTNTVECCLKCCSVFLLFQKLYNFFHSSVWRWDVLQNTNLRIMFLNLNHKIFKKRILVLSSSL